MRAQAESEHAAVGSVMLRPPVEGCKPRLRAATPLPLINTHEPSLVRNSRARALCASVVCCWNSK